MAKQKDIVINQWKEGVASSPMVGYNMRNIDLDNILGIVKINKKTSENTDYNTNNALTARDFTANTSTDRITLSSAQDMPNGTGVVLSNAGGTGNTETFNVTDSGASDTIIFESLIDFVNGAEVTIAGGSLPAGITAGTYYLKRQSASTYEVYTDSGLTSLVDITGNGSGTANISESLPMPLVSGSTYYTYQVDTSTYKLMPTYADALANTNDISFTSTGTGTHTLTPTVIGKITYFVEDGNTTYAIDDDNKVWQVADGSSWGVISGNNAGTGKGFMLWKNHLIASNGANNDIDAYNLSTGVWSNNILSADGIADLESTQTTRYMHIGVDDRLYIANERFLARIQETDGQTFDAANVATYSGTNKALNLPYGEVIKSIESLGVDLMLGTDKSNIYRWDRTSDTYYNPLKVNAGSIDLLVTMNNRTYIFPSGTTNSAADIYITDSATITKIATIPNYLIGESKTTASPSFYNGAKYIKNGKIFFVISGQGDGDAFNGVWSLTSDGVLNFEHQNSQDELGASQILNGACTSKYLAYSFNSVNYVDDISTTLRYTGYRAFIESPLIRIGTANQRTSYRQFDIYLSEPLETGEGIKLKVRDERNATYETIGTVDYSNNGAIQKWSFHYFFEGENMQIRAELTTGASSSSTPELIEIRAR